MLAPKRIEEILESTKVKEIVDFNQKIITIPFKSTIKEAMEILSINNILSAPVESQMKGKYLGFIDTLDILAYVMKVYNEEKTPIDGPKLQIWCQDLHKLEIKGKEFFNHIVSDVIDLSNRNAFRCIEADSFISELLLLFREGIHRAAILEKGSIVGIVSQSNVIQFLAKNVQYYGMIAQTPIQDINLGFHNQMITIKSDARAIHAFHQIYSNGISGMAIVDKEDVLLANLSASDLKGLNEENFNILLLPVLDFLKKKHEHLKLPFTVLPSTTFEMVILKFFATRAHRLWVVDSLETFRVQGVISLTDVMKLLDLRVYIHCNESL